MGGTHAVVSTSHLMVPRRLRAPASHRLGLLQGLFTTEPFPAIVLAPLLPACWAVGIAGAIGWFHRCGELPCSCSVCQQEGFMGGENTFWRLSSSVCAQARPQPPPGPHPSAALSTYILSHLRPPMPFLPPLLPLSQTREEVNGEDV